MAKVKVVLGDNHYVDGRLREKGETVEVPEELANIFAGEFEQAEEADTPEASAKSKKAK